jgi:type III secretion system low calcium response chaperone LcrH/SycD
MSNEDKQSEETATKGKGVCQETIKKRTDIMKQVGDNAKHMDKFFKKSGKKFKKPTREDIEKSRLYSKERCSGLQDIFETCFFTKDFLGMDLNNEQKDYTKKFFEQMEYSSVLIEGLCSGKKLGELFGLNRGALEAIYDQGYTQFLAGNYRKANSIFSHLCNLEPQVYKYQFAYAASKHKEEDYFGAVYFYCSASLLEPLNPSPHFHSIDCYLKQENYVSAIAHLDITLEMCKGNPKYKKIEEDCKNIEHYFKEHYYKKPKKKKKEVPNE